MRPLVDRPASARAHRVPKAGPTRPDPPSSDATTSSARCASARDPTKEIERCRAGCAGKRHVSSISSRRSGSRGIPGWPGSSNSAWLSSKLRSTRYVSSRRSSEADWRATVPMSQAEAKIVEHRRLGREIRTRSHAASSPSSNRVELSGLGRGPRAPSRGRRSRTRGLPHALRARARARRLRTRARARPPSA